MHEMLKKILVWLVYWPKTLAFIKKAAMVLDRAKFYLLIIFALSGGYFIIWELPEVVVPPIQKDLDLKERLVLVNENRRTFAGVFGGVAVFLSLFVAWKRTEAAMQTAEASLRIAEAAEKGQITERFTRAIEQLGSTTAGGEINLELRLGGIYGLEHIAREAPDQYHWVVMEVLTSYIRTNSPYVEKAEGLDTRLFVSEDIQTAFTVIGRRIVENDPNGSKLNLSGSNLSRIDGRGFQFANAEFPMVNLYGSILVEANLTGAYLGGANLTEAVLYKPNLTGVKLYAANLTGAKLYAANLTGADMREANLTGTDFSEAELINAFRPENDIPGWEADENGYLHKIES